MTKFENRRINRMIVDCISMILSLSTEIPVFCDFSFECGFDYSKSDRWATGIPVCPAIN
jgi:hypothetical protein